MARCPNCGQETARTEDWSCQWCGYPLLYGSYKKIQKTYRELKEERLSERTVVEEAEPEPETALGLEPELEVVSEPEAIPQPEPMLEPETEPVLETEPEVIAEPVSEPKPKVKRKAAAKSKAALKSKPSTRAKSTTRRKTAKKPESAPEVESEQVTEIETEPVLEAETEPVLEAETEPVLEAETEPVLEAETEPVSEVEPEIVPAAIEMTAEELLSAYEAEGEAADARFTNQILRITGVVDRIEVKDALDVYYITLISAEKNMLLQGVRCVFNRKHGPELEQLTAGQTVTVQGKYVGSMIDISLRDCFLVR